MNHDFRKSKAGDWAWNIRFGWKKIYKIYKFIEDDYPICFAEKEPHTILVKCTLDGKYHEDDVAPSWFLEPPDCFNAGSPPEMSRQIMIKTGRLTNLAYKAIRMALDNPRDPIKVRDHHNTRVADGALMLRVRSIIHRIPWLTANITILRTNNTIVYNGEK